MPQRGRCAVAGSAFPSPAPQVARPLHPLEAIRVAALSATLWCAPLLRRRVLVQLALEQGWQSPSALADACDASPRTLRRLATQAVDDAARAAARLCLGDARLGLAPEVLAAVGLPSRLRVRLADAA